MADPRAKYDCPACGDEYGATVGGKLRSHKSPLVGEDKQKCPGSGTFVTELPMEAPTCDTPPEAANSATCSNASDTGESSPETLPPTTDTLTTPSPATATPPQTGSGRPGPGPPRV